jgi:hypothetical protein
MKAEEIIEVLKDFGASSGEAYNKWLKRLEEAVYLEMSEALKFLRDDEVEAYSTSLAAFVMRCYSVEVVELVLKLANTDYEHMIPESIERFRKEKKERFAKNKERL